MAASAAKEDAAETADAAGEAGALGGVGTVTAAGDAATGAAADAVMPIAERFVSINGEGPRAGRLAAFIRFTGCNLACSWCDTSWATPRSAPHEDATIAELTEWVAGTGAACVTLTGGEPALQPALPQLIEALCTSEVWGGGLDAPRVVEIETNGAVDLAELDDLRQHLTATAPAPLAAQGRTEVCFTVDCKMPSSGMTAQMVEANYRLVRSGDAVKFVVASHEDLDCARELIESEGLVDRCEVFLSPVFSCIDPAEIVDYMEQHRLAAVRLQLQLHKIIWPGQDKGV